MENLFEALRVSHFLASNEDDFSTFHVPPTLGDTMFSMHAALKSTGAASLW